MLISFMVFGQKNLPFPGFQLGYSYSKAHIVDGGINAYWFKTSPNKNYHVFGPFLAATAIFTKDALYVGQRLGFNYHFMYTNVVPGKLEYSFRISPAIENNCKDDIRIGADLGISYLGLYLYAGYYEPVGSFESERFTKFRFGFRYVFNLWEDKDDKIFDFSFLRGLNLSK